MSPKRVYIYVIRLPLGQNRHNGNRSFNILETKKLIEWGQTVKLRLSKPIKVPNVDNICIDPKGTDKR